MASRRREAVPEELRAAPPFALLFTGVGRELGAGCPGGRSAASLTLCALTLEHLPLLPSRRQSVPSPAEAQKQEMRPGHSHRI